MSCRVPHKACLIAQGTREIEPSNSSNALYMDIGELLCGVVLSAKITAVRVFREAELLQASQQNLKGSTASADEMGGCNIFGQQTRQRSVSLLSFGDSDPLVAVYIISVETYHCQYQITKRFSEFHQFKEELEAILKNTVSPELEGVSELFPSKTLFSRLDEEFLETRRVQLQSYLDAAIKIEQCGCFISKFLEADKYSELR